jgi:hypothetical protein
VSENENFQLEDVIAQALTGEISDTAYLQRLSRKAAKAVMDHINELSEAAMSAGASDAGLNVPRCIEPGCGQTGEPR